MLNLHIYSKIKYSMYYAFDTHKCWQNQLNGFIWPQNNRRFTSISIDTVTQTECSWYDMQPDAVYIWRKS